MADKHETEIARQLFLYGAGDGKRLMSVKSLVEATGLHEATINRHMPKWKKESEQLLSGTNECGLALLLSKESLKAHELDMLALRGQIDQVKWELETLEDVTEKLENWMDKFSGDSESQDKALRILEAWQRNCGQKSSLRSQFLSLQKQWTSLSGIVDLKEVQITREKTMAVGRAKMKLKSEENNNETGLKAPTARGGIFARPALDVEQ